MGLWWWRSSHPLALHGQDGVLSKFASRSTTQDSRPKRRSFIIRTSANGQAAVFATTFIHLRDWRLGQAVLESSAVADSVNAPRRRVPCNWHTGNGSWMAKIEAQHALTGTGLRSLQLQVTAGRATWMWLRAGCFSGIWGRGAFV
jgi:hypothetical protein